MMRLRCGVGRRNGEIFLWPTRLGSWRVEVESVG